MSHRWLEGEVFHKRFYPTEHQFTYDYCMIDIDVSKLSSLKNRFFSYGGFNLFSFKPQDHFGQGESFLTNIDELLKKFSLKNDYELRFLTLPRILGFVFNPISALVLSKEGKLEHMLVEVHNYNGGRIVYPVVLTQKDESRYEGTIKKDMYVSPFLKREGEYRFTLSLTQTQMQISVALYEEAQKMLIASLTAKVLPFTAKSSLKIFCSHTFLSFFVVTRTLWQSFWLSRKGLQFTKPQPIDQVRRY